MRHIILISMLMVVAIFGCGHRSSPIRMHSDEVPQVDVDQEVWTMLTEELSKQLATKKTASPPISRVIDLTAIGDRSGKATLVWSFPVLKGDYNNDGKVDVGDITPLAMYYGQRSDSGTETIFVNGDDNPVINVADVTSIAMNFGAHLQGFRVYRGKWDGEVVNWESAFRPNPDLGNPSWSINRIEPVELTTEYTYEDSITLLLDDHLSVTGIRYKVVAYGEDEGAESNMAVMPDLAPLSGIVGSVKLNDVVPLSGIVVKLMPTAITTTTDENGQYTFALLNPGDYTVIVEDGDGHWFEPRTISVAVSETAVSQQNFTARLAGLANSPWPKFQANSGNTGQGTMVGPLTDNVRWKCPLGSGAMFYSSPSIGQSGTIYVQKECTLFAITNNGGESWRVEISPSSFVISSPLIGNGERIYIGCQNNRLYSFDAFGDLKWASDTEDLIAGIPGSPAISEADGKIYAGSKDGNLYAFYPQDGGIAWEFPSGGEIYTSPAVGVDGTIYVGNEAGFLYAINPDGSEKWMFPTDSGEGIGTSPVIGEDGSVYFWGYDEVLYAVHPDGSEKWAVPLTGYGLTTPVLAGDAMYVASMDATGSVYKLTLDGEVEWTFFAESYSFNYIGADGIGCLYVTSYSGKIYALNPDKSVKWEFATGGPIESSPAVGNGVLYVLSEDGYVYAFGQ